VRRLEVLAGQQHCCAVAKEAVVVGVPQELEAAAVRELQVDDHQVIAAVVQARERVRDCRCPLDVMPSAFERRQHEIAERTVVVDDQNAAGRQDVNRLNSCGLTCLLVIHEQLHPRAAPHAGANRLPS